MPMQISISNVIGGAAARESFINNYSIEVDGIDAYVNCGTNSSLNFEHTDAFSFSLWFKRDVSNVFHILLSKMNPTGNRRGYFFGINTDNVVVVQLKTDTSSGNQKLTYKSTNTITDTNWHHIVFTYDGLTAQSSGKIYIDGVAETMDSSGGGAITSIQSSATTPFLMSALNTATPPLLPANGNIDEVAVFGSELLASDVSAIYGTGVPNDITDLNPISWWRFEEGSGTTASDSGSASNTGTLDNAVFSTNVPT